ncbi:Akirin [Armadillidium nasatum]|uniref:Akirin n=1 Tax=Armadillidium nasatum TaxID=96803 RepID=A0A5N5STY0_9CRUS|nr:Akirin [Armadillidium nasatum]
MACLTRKRSLDFDSIHTPGSYSPRLHKRRRCMPMCVSPQSSAATSVCDIQPQSPFINAAAPLTPEEIAKNVKEEIRRLKRRRQLHLGEKGMDLEGGYESPTSPQNSTTHGIYSPISSVSNQPSPSNKDKALFTFKQVTLICERLMKERESKIQEEYNELLAKKLKEQYECFVCSTDQIQQRLTPESLPSYLS